MSVLELSSTVAPPSRVIGRHDVVERVRTALQRGRLVTLVGTGGIGKTAVALRYAELHGGEHPDGARLVDLRGARDVDGVVTAFLRALGVRAAHGGHRRAGRAAPGGASHSARRRLLAAP